MEQYDFFIKKAQRLDTNHNVVYGTDSVYCGFVVLFGISPEPPEDEGTAARLYQLLLGGQIPVVVLFAVSWLPKKPKQALQVLALQIAAFSLAFTPVYILEKL